jgi:hypothetical protein
MNGPLYHFSAATVSFARLFGAGVSLALALVFALIVLWLTLTFGLNWFIIIFDILLGLGAAGLFVTACEVYSTSRLPERPDERERYLQSRSLYNPNGRREATSPRTRVVVAYPPESAAECGGASQPQPDYFTCAASPLRGARLLRCGRRGAPFTFGVRLVPRWESSATTVSGSMTSNLLCSLLFASRHLMRVR